MIHLQLKAVLATLGLLLLGTSCSTTSYHEEYRLRLGEAQASLEKTQYLEANNNLVDLVDEVLSQDDSSYDLQGFMALFQLMRMHELASFSHSYMTESVKSRTVVNRKSGGRGPSRTGHLVAATYFAGKLLALAPSMYEAPRVVEEVELLPKSLSKLTPTGVDAYSRLLLASGYARLGLYGQARDMLFETEEPAFEPFKSRDDKADRAVFQILAERDVLAGTQAWIFLTLHRRHRDAVPQRGLAYRYGIRALEAARKAEVGLKGNDADWVGQLEDEFHSWILELKKKEGGGQFKADDTTAYSETVMESGDGEPIIDFTFQQK